MLPRSARLRRRARLTATPTSERLDRRAPSMEPSAAGGPSAAAAAAPRRARGPPARRRGRPADASPSERRSRCRSGARRAFFLGRGASRSSRHELRFRCPALLPRRPPSAPQLPRRRPRPPPATGRPTTSAAASAAVAPTTSANVEPPPAPAGSVPSVRQPAERGRPGSTATGAAKPSHGRRPVRRRPAVSGLARPSPLPSSPRARR